MQLDVDSPPVSTMHHPSLVLSPTVKPLCRTATNKKSNQPHTSPVFPKQTSNAAPLRPDLRRSDSPPPSPSPLISIFWSARPRPAMPPPLPAPCTYAPPHVLNALTHTAELPASFLLYEPNSMSRSPNPTYAELTSLFSFGTKTTTTYCTYIFNLLNMQMNLIRKMSLLGI